MDIKITIANKRCTVQGTPVIVCGNSTYTITFTFDAEWDQVEKKTARFSYVRDGVRRSLDVDLTGDTVEVPAVYKTRELQVGVYAGDLVTSTPARIPCEKSIVCDSCTPEDLFPSQYEQLRNQLTGYLDEQLDDIASIHYCVYTAKLNQYGQIAHVDGENTNAFAKGLPKVKDLFITTSGYVGRVYQVVAAQTNTGKPAHTIAYALVANLNGHTPVRGVDYWTEADKEEMAAEVIAALPIYNGEVEAV